MPFAADADHQQADLYRELARELLNTPPAIVQELDITDESFSSAFRKDGAPLVYEDPETGQKFYLNFGGQTQIQGILGTIAKGESLSEEQLSQVDRALAAEMTPEQRAVVMAALLDKDVRPSEVRALGQLLAASTNSQSLTGEASKLLIKQLAEQPEKLALLMRIAPSPAMAEEIASSFVKEILREAATTITDPSLREYFLDESRTEKELTALFEYLPSDKRVEILAKKLDTARQDSATEKFLRDKLDNALHHLTSSEKAELLKLELQQPRANNFLEEILESARGMSELRRIVKEVGAAKLTASSDRDVVSLVAMAELSTTIESSLEKVERIKLSDPEAALKQLTEELELLREALRSSPWPYAMSTRDYIRTLDSTLADLTVIEEAAKDDLDNLTEQTKLQIEVVKLELRYGVNLSYGSSADLSKSDDAHQGCDHEHHHGHDSGVEACTGHDFGVDHIGTQEPMETNPRWTLEDLKQIERVLSAIPERHMLFTPMIRDIELVSSLGRGVLGARYRADGKIKIANITRDNWFLSTKYEGENSLAIVLAHELGHSLQISNGRSGFDFSDWKNPDFGAGELSIDFDEFLALSGWQVYSSTRFSAGQEMGTVILDGVQYETDVPVEVNGEWVVLLYDSYYNLLTSYDAEAEFSNRWYAKVSPWEDFAEAFSEYLFLPERLIKDAPEKFKHIEEEFRRYENNSSIQRLLAEALKD